MVSVKQPFYTKHESYNMKEKIYLGGVNDGIGGLRLGRKAPYLLLGVYVVPAELVDQHFGPVLGIFVYGYELVVNSRA
jgi:hypothetical protein